MSHEGATVLLFVNIYSIISIFHYFFMVKGLSFSRRHDGPMVSVLCYISRGQGSRPGCVNDCCVFGQLTQML